VPYIQECAGSGGGSGGGCDPTTGTTTPFVGTTTNTTTGDLIPSTEGNLITAYSIRCAVDQPTATRLEFSIDDGISWHRLRVGEGYWDTVKNTRQIKIRAAGTAITQANYEIILQRGTS
jgi:hypothetical protein